MEQVAGVFRARYNRQAKVIQVQWLVILALVFALAYSLIAQPFAKAAGNPAVSASTSEPITAPDIAPISSAMPESVAPVPSEPVPAEPVSLGEFKLTAYCACEKCCEKTPDDPLYGVTAYGYKTTAGRTIAVDPSIIPIGSEVIINGHTYVAEDVGGAIKENRIDIYFNTHQEALEFGVQYAEVFIKQ